MIDIMNKESWIDVSWNIYNSSISKNMNLFFNKNIIDKINEYKNKIKQYRLNMINIKKVRKAEKLIGNIYSGLIISVQSYGFC